jgi:glycine cleavage system transcriptional repressor
VRHFAVSAIGSDRPGIVAAVSEALLEHDGNIEDSQMTILRGHFAIMLLVATGDSVDADELRTALAAISDRMGLEAISVNEVSDIAPEDEPLPSHMLTVYGTDHPGIVHAVTSSLAERNVNITDLETRLLSEDDGERLYAMMIEVSLPAGMSSGDLDEQLRPVREQQGVVATIRPLEQDTL